ncbi:hypothetical protein POM88_004195 [Heracleum sosnowskyi]|uniref:TF-B3 domain-containing protein n=1 Tax=Heracleum sosnowskyi TaxID=360622 RepID=A0AAD8JMD4_9APIA|nr:hypothetical protein POM88_004195 [Heracleum sosnowskyi]
MDSTSKFVKLLGRGECVLTDLFVPHVFCEKYASAIPLTVKLIIRDGYEIWVDFDKNNERFIGLGYLFSHFSLIRVSLYDGGWSFASYLNYERNVVDEVVVPRSFLDVVDHLLPDKLELLVSSGLHVVGLFNRKDRKISGFESICNMLGVSKLNRFNALVLKYVLGNTFHNVSVDFNFVREWWNRVDYITAYKDQRCWSLQIRIRRDWKRTTIHKGWIQFRDDMELSVGDVCVFRWKNDTVHNFDIDIVRAVTHVE